MSESAISAPHSDLPSISAAQSYEISIDEHIPFFEQRFPEVFELFFRMGINPTRVSSTPSIYLSRMDAPHRPNIGLHSIGVALCARALASALGPHPKTPGLDLEDITRRALLHDIGKPFELMRRDQRRDSKAVYSDKAYEEVYKLLLNAGVSETDAVTVVTSGVDAGHLSVRRFLYVDHSGTLRLAAGNIPGKIIHLADSMVLSTVPTEVQACVNTICIPTARILSGLARQRYPWLWEVGLALDGDKEIVETQDIRSASPGDSVLGAYAEVLAWASRAICAEFVSLRDVFRGHGHVANVTDTDAELEILNEVVSRLREPFEFQLAS